MLKKVPHTYVIVFGIIVIAAVLTWIIPPGQYTEQTYEVDGEEHTQMVFYYESNLPAEYRSGKSAIVNSLLQTLAAKSYETETHTRNMQEVANSIGEKMG
ncbi:MAG: hypothetical protein R6U64_08155, partial [Bacteroidales bacterium]